MFRAYPPFFAAALSLPYVAFFAFAQPTMAGAWVKEKGAGELIINGLYFHSDAFYDRNGDKQSQPDFNKYEINPYAEYGLTDEWTVGANLFLHYIEQDITSADNDNLGLADSEFFARRELLSYDGGTLSIQPLIKLPSLYSDGLTPRSGSKDFDAELSVLSGHNFIAFDRYHYVEARLGYRHRFHGELEDQVKLDIKAGLNIADDWQIIPAAYSIWAVNGSNETGFTEDGQNNYHLIKLEAMLRHDLSEALYLQGGAYTHVYGRNVGNGTGALLGLGLYF